MSLFAKSNHIKIILVILLIALGIGSVIYNQYLVTKILEQERASVELWSKAIEFNSRPLSEQAGTKLLKAVQLLREVENVPDSVITLILEAEAAKTSADFVSEEIIIEQNRFKIPTIVVDSNGVILHNKNIPPHRFETRESRQKLVQEFKNLNPPLNIIIGDERKQISQFVYYGESPTVQQLRYFPFIQIALVTLLLGIGYTTFRSITRSEQSNLWVGMAKEAAHQLGTPISSLYGWLQILEEEYKDNEEITKLAAEIENDVQRLRGVAERFGKIGSAPELQLMEIEPILEQVIRYLEQRIPRLGQQVEIQKALSSKAKVMVNPELFQWAIENLVKNALDALQHTQGEARIKISSKTERDEVIIDIEDSGTGIDIKNLRSIFKPGMSTKKRGWGLGLSLTKRIIEDYHNGSVFVLRSALNEGTTMRITLRLAEPAK